MLAEEREEADETPTFPCSDAVWQGFFRNAADLLGKRSWEVWMGIACGLAARAHRNIHVRYYGNLHGNLYGLLIKPTGLGKKLCTDTCEALLPEWYTWRRGVQSGPGLAPLLAEIERDKKTGRPTSIAPRPVCLVIPEWSTLAKNLKIQHATLAEDLNELFDCPSRWSVSRSDRPGSGGGDLVIPTPSLSICATTTASLFSQEVTPAMIRSGFMNRYLILPGSLTRWTLYDPDAAPIDPAQLSTLPLDASYTLGLGASVWSLYADDAKFRFLAWGTPLFEGELMNDPDSDLELYKRLHTYAHKIALLYAWSVRSPRITREHVEAAIAVIDTSRAFLQSLLSTAAPLQPPQRVQYEISLTEKILDKIRRESGRVDLRKLAQDLRKSATSADLKRVVDDLLAAAAIHKTDQRWLRFGPPPDRPRKPVSL